MYRRPLHSTTWLLLSAMILCGCSRSLPTAPRSTALGSGAQDALPSAVDDELAADRREAARRETGLRVAHVHMDIAQLQDGAYVYSLEQAQALLDQPGNAATKHFDCSGELSFSDLEGACCVVYPSYRNWEDLVPFPGSGRPAPEGFAVRIRGTLLVPRRTPASGTGNWWTLAVASDDGFRLRVFTGSHGESERGSDVWEAEHPEPRGIAVGPLLPVRFPTQGGEFKFELIYYELGGGAILHVAAASGMREGFSTNMFSLLDSSHAIKPIPEQASAVR